MSWNSITIANVRLTPAEKAALQAIQGSTAIGAELLTNVTGEFLGAIRAGGGQVVSDGTVPDAVRVHVINRTRWLWLCEFPQLKALQTKERGDLNAAAEKFMEAVTTGTPKIEPPATPDQESVSLVTMPSTGPKKLR